MDELSRWMVAIATFGVTFSLPLTLQAKPPEISYSRGEWQVPAGTCKARFTDALKKLQFDGVEGLDETSIQGIKGDYVAMTVCDPITDKVVNYAIIVSGPTADEAEKYVDAISKASE
ncbi:MAG TPA: hypothetical protein IGS53_23850 [Leptolyngbyaceae cyanobacterium M33_DOE_097]|uniref:Uncharacterized protein n=1 Tax=Oscillatoriales cyanobacterium SpSt-418 TaxID=2282169 RepID=A0A7C3KIL3_9CYAN|nr:hypothetical protein [Leptolyngbyaceae cyanobacterium M33_DOE_097]